MRRRRLVGTRKNEVVADPGTDDDLIAQFGQPGGNQGGSGDTLNVRSRRSIGCDGDHMRAIDRKQDKCRPSGSPAGMRRACKA